MKEHVPAQTPEELLQDIRALVTEAEAMASDSLKTHSVEAIDALRARLDSAQERLARLCAATRQKVIAGARYTDEKIHEHPYQAMAIAAGLGLIAGIVLGRNCNK